METKITNNDAQTYNFGFEFAKALKRGQVIALSGDLGAGKTVFVKGIAKALGIGEHILSPTFTLLRQYKGLNHFDVYRIDDIDELYEIGFSEYLDDDNITVIEWANLIFELMPKDVIYVDIRKTVEEDQRVIFISDTPIDD